MEEPEVYMISILNSCRSLFLLYKLLSAFAVIRLSQITYLNVE